MRTLCLIALWFAPSFALGATKRVAVLPLENPGKLPAQEINFLTDLIRGTATDNLSVAKFTVMTEDNLEAMLPPGKTLADCIGECAVETGKNLKAHYIVTGRVYKIGSSRRLSLRVHVTRTAAMLKQMQFKGTGAEDFETAIQEGANPLFDVIRRHAHGGVASLGATSPLVVKKEAPAKPAKPAARGDSAGEGWDGCRLGEYGLSMMGWCGAGSFYGLVHLGYLFWAKVEGDTYGMYQFGVISAETQGSIWTLFQLSMLSARVGADFNGLSQASALNQVGGRMTGVQLGLFNHAARVRGVQFGLMNSAGQLRGVQIGLVNTSDDGGLPFMLGANIGW